MRIWVSFSWSNCSRWYGFKSGSCSSLKLFESATTALVYRPSKAPLWVSKAPMTPFWVSTAPVFDRSRIFHSYADPDPYPYPASQYESGSATLLNSMINTYSVQYLLALIPYLLGWHGFNFFSGHKSEFIKTLSPLFIFYTNVSIFPFYRIVEHCDGRSVLTCRVVCSGKNISFLILVIGFCREVRTWRFVFYFFSLARLVESDPSLAQDIQEKVGHWF